jgi:uncharacterized protein YecE (DUF72 family)
MAALIKVGISAWTEPTLVQSGWYPRQARTAEARLRHYASRFPLAEVDSGYYGLPTERQAEAWVERTPRDFTMNVKANALLTAHYTDPRRLPRDLQQALTPALRGKPRLYARDLPPELLAEVARRFSAALGPLRASGKLGLVLLQYPVWFPCSRPSRQELEATCERLAGLPLAVEFRNWTWLSPRNREVVLAFLRAHGLAYTCVDEPQGFSSSLPPLAAVTAPIALVRFHGRNARRWAGKNPSAAVRLQYRYRPDELGEWVPRVHELCAQADQVHVVMNNCHGDDAVTNAAELADLLAQAAEPVVDWREHAQPASLHSGAR